MTENHHRLPPSRRPGVPKHRRDEDANSKRLGSPFHSGTLSGHSRWLAGGLLCALRQCFAKLTSLAT